MELETMVAAVMLVGIVVYALLGGADYGGGMWDLLATGPRAREQRELIADAIGPVWEANHVWLILVIVVLFSCFPSAFGIVMTALHIPMTLVLVGIVLRGTSFVFRKYDAQDDRTHRRWSRIFAVGSFFTPFLLGLCLGALASGEIEVVEGVLRSGFLAGWTDWFAVACGLFAQGLFAFLAATYMTVEASGDSALEGDFRRRAILSGLSLAPAAVLVLLAAQEGAATLYHRLTDWWAPLLLAVTSICAVAALVALFYRQYRIARVAAAAQVALILLGWGIAQYPYIVIDSVTFAATAAPETSLRLVLIGLAAGSPILLISLYFLFRTFKARGKGTRMVDVE